MFIFQGCDHLDDDQLPVSIFSDFDSESFLTAGSTAIIDLASGIESNQPVNLNIVAPPANDLSVNQDGNEFTGNQNTVMKEENLLPLSSVAKLSLRKPDVSALIPWQKKSVTAGLRNESINFTEEAIAGYKTSTSAGDITGFTIIPEFRKDNRTISFNRRELGIQLGASLILYDGKIIQQSIGGSFALHKNLINEARTNLINESVKLSAYFSYVSVFYKIDYRLARQFDLILQPVFNYASFINADKSSPIYIKPNNVSLNFGIAFHL